jgi:hypothetical protein
MRKTPLLASTMLALIVPFAAHSAPQILQSEPPAPFMLRQPQRQAPPPSAVPAPQRVEQPAPQRVEQPVQRVE